MKAGSTIFGEVPPKKGCRRAASLPTVIMVVALMLMLAFTVVAIGFSHLNLTFRSSNNLKAKELAEAVLAVAIERTRIDVENFGIKGSAADKTIKLSLAELPPGNLGVLSFDPDTAASLGVPVSTNNRSESASEGSGEGATLGQSIHIVAKAEVGGSTSIMEAIVEFPKFPYSIASEGSIKSGGGLLVAAVRPGASYTLDHSIDLKDLQPGSMVSNSSNPESSIDLSGKNIIMGDLQTVAQAVKIADGGGDDVTTVKGEVRLNADRVKLPRLSASDYDPLSETAKQRANDPDSVKKVNPGPATLKVKGYNVFGTKLSDGSYNQNETLTVDNGIELDGGVLFVNGNLDVSAGGIKGKGAIIATGNINISGSGEAFTDNEAALVADGNIILKGASVADKAKFSGLIYTKGQMQATNLRLAGVFVAAGENSAVELKDTELYQVNEKSKIEIKEDLLDMNYTSKIRGKIEDTNVSVDVTYEPTVLEKSLDNYKNPNPGPGEPKYLFKYKAGNVYYRLMPKPDGTGNQFVVTSGPDQYVLDAAKIGGVRIDGGGPLLSSLAEIQSGILASYVKNYQTELNEGIFTMKQLESKAEESAARAFLAGDYFTEIAEQAQAIPSNAGQDTDEEDYFNWSLDLSEFFSKALPMKIVYWAAYRS